MKFEPFTLLPGVQKSQMLSMDIMVVGKQLSMIIVATPLEMTFTKKLHGKTEIELGDAIISQIEEINGKGFKVEKVIWDSEPSVKRDYRSGKIRGTVYELEIFEPGRHVARVERKIQRLMAASGLPNGLSLWVKPFGSPDWPRLKKMSIKNEKRIQLGQYYGQSMYTILCAQIKPYDD